MNKWSDVAAETLISARPTYTQLEDLGVLLFAFDNTQIDYVSLAAECARRIRRYWGVPVSLVTDTRGVPDGFDQIIHVDKATLKENPKVYLDYEANLQFWNSNRCNALELSPYRRTILLDVDVLVQTDTIPRVWDGEGLRLTKEAYSVFSYHQLSQDMRILSKQNGLPMYWATVVCFDRESEDTKSFFNEWKRALANYKTYAHLYGFSPAPVRNDFAVTIALYKMIDGRYSDSRFNLPYQIPSLLPTSALIDVEDDCLLVANHEGGTTAVYSDLHVMNKKSILECLHRSILKETDSTANTNTES